MKDQPSEFERIEQQLVDAYERTFKAKATAIVRTTARLGVERVMKGEKATWVNHNGFRILSFK